MEEHIHIVPMITKFTSIQICVVPKQRYRDLNNIQAVYV